MSGSRILGIDIGSVSISVVEVTAEKEIIRTAYAFHRGKIAECLKSLLSGTHLSEITAVAATTSTPAILRADYHTDNRVAVIAACRHFHEKFGAILIVGAEKFGLIQFDWDGNYANFKANTACAAGTGSFLDQQAQRLNLGDIQALCKLANQNTGAIPKIASRCAVFAKTDLVHAQQEGYNLTEICDGLCFGLAKNIVDTLFSSHKVRGPLVFAGGVAKNRAVVRHIQKMIGLEMAVERIPYGAAGAALCLLDDMHGRDRNQRKTLSPFAEDIFTRRQSRKSYYYEPLKLKLSSYPEFDSIERYESLAGDPAFRHPVEVEIYIETDSASRWDAYLGFDIGSTSTKAVLLGQDRTVLAGFYTRTSGRPVMATQKLLAAISEWAVTKPIVLNIIGAGTTGSGRKFVGKIMAADLVVDEITAHARAAVWLNPNVDTIIEIGGQDSKFTTLKNGRVTLSIMNTVCAAGTGSFIEEQAEKLGCPLVDYTSRTENQRSPMASDRCTVFMERDINHCIADGFCVDEALASTLHAIRENYLTKVAIENHIGDTIFFQGATAKNKALVAAFEQQLQKPIHVSKYCHLTGALGTALMLAEQKFTGPTKFRGLGFHKKPVVTRSEICTLCSNHCKITLADLDGETVAYGFLCGRDYAAKKRRKDSFSGFDLLKQRRKIFTFTPQAPNRSEPTIGIPAALHLYEDLHFWRYFFNRLGLRTKTSEGCRDAIKAGRNIAEAEFCAPLTALHGHVQYLLGAEQAPGVDYIFLPNYFERKSGKKGVRRQYCYYTQFAPALGVAVGERERAEQSRAHPDRILTPLLYYLYGSFHTKVQLYRMLRKITKRPISYFEVSSAYDKTLAYKRRCNQDLKKLYQRRALGGSDIHAVFLGRPYTVLSRTMNKGIPDIFASLGVRTFFQDMLSYGEEDVRPIRPLLDELHWYYAARITAAAEVIAGSAGAYPVLVTSFRCSPDSFVIDYFKQILDAHQKPYLILQLDDHNSAVGYETRIEAAVRSFRNHYRTHRTVMPVKYTPGIRPVKTTQMASKTLLIPNWDNLSMRLVVACLRREGIDARLLEETPAHIQKSLRNNTGQCLPLNIIAQEFIDYIEKHGLAPATTSLWMVLSVLPCNLSLFPHHIRNILHAYGKGMEKAGVYVGKLSFADISIKLPVNMYFAHMFGGLMRKIACKLRPYETNRGETDRVVAAAMDILIEAFEGNRSREDALTQVIARFQKIETTQPTTGGNSRESRPKVAIFGDLYVRDNEVMNQNLIRYIEENGGEVITTPYSAFIKIIARSYLRKWFIEGDYAGVLTSKALLSTFTRFEKIYYRYFQKILNEPNPVYDASPKKILTEYNLKIEHTGESMENILKIYYTLKYHPDVSLFVQTSPAFCCPALITEGMAGRIENKTGVPFVSITYDGTGGNKNEAIVPYLKFPRKKTGRTLRRAG
jgi:predicted CoA-substrate-specific enzyme activase